MTVSAWFRGSGSPGTFRYLVGQGLEPLRERVLRAVHGQRGLAFYVGDG